MSIQKLKDDILSAISNYIVSYDIESTSSEEEIMDGIVNIRMTRRPPNKEDREKFIKAVDKILEKYEVSTGEKEVQDEEGS